MYWIQSFDYWSNGRFYWNCSFLGSLCACTLVEHSALWMPLLSALVQSSSLKLRVIWALWRDMVLLHLSHKCRASRLGINSRAQLATASAAHWWGPTGWNMDSQLALSAVLLKHINCLWLNHINIWNLPLSKTRRQQMITTLWAYGLLLETSQLVVLFSEEGHQLKTLRSSAVVVRCSRKGSK